jgi:hypothetical protein
VFVGFRLGLDAIHQNVDLSIVGTAMVVFQRPVEQVTAFRSQIFEDLPWRRFAFVERADFVCAAMY